MKPKCTICHYYCYDYFAKDEEHKYDYTDSFCGLHGREHIENPNETPPDLMHAQNKHYNCRCGFRPLHHDPIQLTLFE